YQDANRPERRMTLFGQFGIGDSRVNWFAYYTGGGLTVSALLAGRKQDEIAFAIAGAHNGTSLYGSAAQYGVQMRRSRADHFRRTRAPVSDPVIAVWVAIL